ncbi:MAG TPA: hypothetical protein VK428_08090 [Acidimicrobiales bacterium]|nr:hypothetical protein [Acidimicrobiales bacterium]
MLGIPGWMLLLVGAVLVQLALSSSSGAGGNAVAVGVYVGTPKGVAGFASATGADVTIAADYQSGASWSAIESSYPADAWTGSPYRLALGVPLLPPARSTYERHTGRRASGRRTKATFTKAVLHYSLADGAGGAYNRHFKTLAEHLVAAGEGNAILHIGWEWDQSGCSWCVSDAADAANFAAYWRQIVTTMRSVPGADFNYSWYYGDGGDSLTTEAWPGASYVSSIDNDFYDQTWDTGCGLAFNNTSTPAESDCVWNKDMLPGLDGLAAFAAQYGEPIGFGEWGVISRSDGHGLGDDPTFVDNFASWIASHDVEYADYFDCNSGGNSVLTDFPKSLDAYRADFG